MNSHLHLFNHYKEYDYESAKENNLTRAFLITLKNEPHLLRSFFSSIVEADTWKEISFDLQAKVNDISSYKRIIGITITSLAIEDDEIAKILPYGSADPVPDFLMWSEDILIVCEVKKSNEIAIAQLKNQVNTIVSCHNANEDLVVSYKSISWTDVLTRHIEPYREFALANGLNHLWVNEFKNYIETFYADWVPVPLLSEIEPSAVNNNINNYLIEKRLYDILRQFSGEELNYRADSLVTAPINFQWATEVAISLDPNSYGSTVNLRLWPGNTKSQSMCLNGNDFLWANEKFLIVDEKSFPLKVEPVIKFSHVMGKFISNLSFGEDREHALSFYRDRDFNDVNGNWNRDSWVDLEKMFDEAWAFDWRKSMEWNENFKMSRKNFLFLSCGFEVEIKIPFSLFQENDRKDQTGKLNVRLVEDTLFSFKSLLELVQENSEPILN
jgi:hypothetical protein